MTNAEYREEKRKVKVPLFFKRKIFMVLMMLLCSGVMAVMATYAWFILATAPEVTGVTTTVGANGSLEIALLTPETGANTSLIRADVGDSIYVVGAVEGNVTWGNLVDLSDASYGLNTIILYPSVLNQTDGTLDTTAMLSTARNGLDGRITRLRSNTAMAVYDGASFTTEGADYGVRAVGSLGSSAGRDAYLSSARNAFSANRQSALAAVQNAVSDNGGVLAAVAMNRDGPYTFSQVSAIKNLAQGAKNALDYILSAYKNAMIAVAAADAGLDDGDFETVRTGINTGEGEALTRNYARYLPTGAVTEDIASLNDSIAQAALAIGMANELLYDAEGEPVAADTQYTFEQISPIINKLADLSTAQLTTYTLQKGAGDGLFTDVADYAGSYGVSLAGLASMDVLTDENGGNGKLAQIDLSGLTAPAGSGDSGAVSTVVTDFYGYVIDLAFRANVDTQLQLQTAAIDRVYTDGAGATAGSGSRVTYTYTEGMNEIQVNSLFSAVRVVFFDPDTGEIYGTARLGTPELTETSASAGLFIIADDGTLSADQTAITDLDQAVPRKVSVLVYLNGTDLNNMSVINSANSGTMLLNLQFSSSVELVPMTDNELRSAVSAEDFEG